MARAKPALGSEHVSTAWYAPPHAFLDRDTGIGALTDAQVVAGIYGVKPDGLPVMPLMPWPYYAGRIAEADLEAIVAFLRSLPAIRNVVPPAEQPAKR